MRIESLWVSCFGFNQNNKYHQYDVYEHIVHAFDNYDGNDFYSILALFFHDHSQGPLGEDLDQCLRMYLDHLLFL